MRRVAQLVRDIESVHRVLRVHDDAFVLRRDARLRELARQRRSADQDRHVYARRAQVLRRHDHLLRRFDEQAG
ncbi:hypothetical protein D3C84_1219900 [compost metagenome]